METLFSAFKKDFLTLVKLREGVSFGKSAKSSIGCPLGDLKEGDLQKEKSA